MTYKYWKAELALMNDAQLNASIITTAGHHGGFAFVTIGNHDESDVEQFLAAGESDGITDRNLIVSVTQDEALQFVKDNQVEAGI